MIVDEFQQQARLNFIEDALLQSYAEVMAEELPGLIEEHCYGCGLVDAETGETYDHPSQLRHNVCVMMDREEQIDYLFEEALDIAENSDITYLIWMEKLATMEPPANFIEYCKYTCEDYKETEMKTDLFKYKVSLIICHLM